MVGVTACGDSLGEAFLCTQTEQCSLRGVQGFCESNGSCSFPDSECASGRRYGEYTPRTLANQCVVTARIPAGTFHMGCTPADPGCPPYATPAHEVEVAAFEIDVTEVTQQAYQACVAAGVCRAPQEEFSPATTPRWPVRYVSWNEANTYCQWVGGALPSEAQWERAARGPGSGFWPWGDTPPDCLHANFKDCGQSQPDPVGSHPDGLNGFGLLDLAGNLFEWTGDWFSETYYGQSARSDPTGPASGDCPENVSLTDTCRVIRGGSFRSDANGVSVSNRWAQIPELATAAIGFRCVRPATH